MKLLLCVLSLALLALPTRAQTKLNLHLQQELDSILEVDQHARMNITPGGINQAEFRRMQQTDSSNLARVRAILKQYGYPGTSLVGASTNEAAWYVIQHSSSIDQYLPMVKAAAEQGELPYFRYAQMLDRQLMSQGKEQLYGTQALNYNPTNPQTGQRESQPPFVWPIKDPRTVNQRRKKTGFRNTVEQNASEIGIQYRVVTLEEVAKMRKE
jgi:hypothetical protein